MQQSLLPPGLSGQSPYCLGVMRSCSNRSRSKSGVREPSIGWDPRRQSRPHPIEGTRDFSRLTEINPYSAPVIRGHMCFVCCTRPIAAIALFTTGFRAFRMSARAKKRLWGGRPRPEPYHPTTFFRLSRRHPPLPYSLPFNRSCSYRARTKSGVREPMALGLSLA